GNFSETRSSQDVRGKPHVDYIEQIEELSAELDGHAFRAGGPPSEGRVLYQCEVVVVIGGSTKGIAAQRAKASLIRPSTPGDVNRNVKISARIRRSHTEVI